MTDALSRRQVLRGAALGAVALGAGVASVACGKEQPKALACSDTTALSPADLQVRQTVLGYVEASTTPGKTCLACQQFIEGPPGGCGTCKIVKGPINPAGYCKSFLAKPT
jgi:hypothetical protein